MSSDDNPRAYPALGLSSFLLPPNSKKAGFSWKRWHTEIIEDWRWGEALDNQPDSNVAIVGGVGGLIIWDIDYQPLVDRLKPLLVSLDTWVVETGSGKLHVYFRSDGDLSGENLDADKQHLGEIRGTGQYVVAPPSRVNEPDHYQTYRTLYGSPTKIRRVKDAKTLIHRLNESATLSSSGLTSRAPSAEVSPPAPLKEEGGSSVPNRYPTPAYDEKEWRSRIHHDERLDPRIKRVILDADDAGFPTRSESDYGSLRALVIAGYSDEEIKAVFDLLPVGERRYRATEGKTHGMAYLKSGIAAARKNVATSIEAAALAQGENFQVVRVTKRMYDVPIYTLTLQVEGRSRTVSMTCEAPDILSQAKMRGKMAAVMDCVPKFIAQGKQFEAFSDAVLKMAEIEEIPEGAKQTGVIREFVTTLIREPNRMLPRIPDDIHEVQLGWYDQQNGHCYVRPVRLLHFTQSTMNPKPTAEKLWEVLAGMGGEERMVTFRESGGAERCWSLPASLLKNSD